MPLQLIDESEIKSYKEPVKDTIIISECPTTNTIVINDNTRERIIDTIKNVGIERVTNAHRIGYACVNTSICATTNKTCRLYNCSDTVLRELITSNLDGMKRIVQWNIEKRITLYRISSVVIPYASHEANKIRWWDEYRDNIADIGKIIKNSGMRVSMHPGQYVNINSPDKGVIDSSIKELEYHAKFMDLLGLDNTHRIVLHIGGAYGDKKSSIKRFIDVYNTLSDSIRSRLTIENDDKTYNVWDVLGVSSTIGIPVIFDILHHQVNHRGQEKDKDIKFILKQCFSTWNKNTGIPKIHLSTQRPGAKYGAHADAVDINMLMGIYLEFINYDFDIMLETKDKDKSVMRAMKILEDAKRW